MDLNTLQAPFGSELPAALGFPRLATPVKYREDPAWHPFEDGELVDRSQYTREDGAPSFEVLRFRTREGHPAHPDKAFLWRWYDEVEGRWRWGLEGVELVLYRLPRVRSAVRERRLVFVVEGEKDVHALEAAGLTATCNPLGGLQWREAYSEQLRGADVVVVPDNDRVGMVHAARVVSSLRGHARCTALLLLPDLPLRGDVSSWLEAGHDAGKLLGLADAAPRDPSPAELAKLLDLPPGVDPLDNSPHSVRTLLAGASRAVGERVPHRPAAAAPPAFSRTLTLFERLRVPEARGIAARTGPAPALQEAQATYRALLRLLAAVDPDRRTLLEDAFALDRACHERALFAPLIRAAVAEGSEESRQAGADEDGGVVVLSPAVRAVHTRWDWPAYLAGGAEPALSAAAHVIQLLPSGALQLHKLNPLAGLVVEAVTGRVSAGEIVSRVAAAVDGGEAGPAAVAAVVSTQLRQLNAAGMLWFVPADPLVSLAGEMRRGLVGEAAPPTHARTLTGLLVRAAAATREEIARAGICMSPWDTLDRCYQLDLHVEVLDQLLAHARVRSHFEDELDRYWSEADVRARSAALLPLLDVLDGALGGWTCLLPPLTFT